MKTRSIAAKPPTLAPTDMKAVTLVGAPSYTSGVHIWKGTAATLKANPTIRKATPASPIEPPPVMPASTSGKAVDWVAP